MLSGSFGGLGICSGKDLKPLNWALGGQYDLNDFLMIHFEWRHQVLDIGWLQLMPGKFSKLG